MMKCRENAKNRFFPHILQEKHALGIVILHQCSKLHEIMSNTAREIQEKPFSGDNRLIRRFLEISATKISFIEN